MGTTWRKFVALLVIDWNQLKGLATKSHPWVDGEIHFKKP